MTSQEQLAFLLDLGDLDYKAAAGIADVAHLTIKAYRKPSSTRNVPEAVLRPLERCLWATGHCHGGRWPRSKTRCLTTGS